MLDRIANGNTERKQNNLRDGEECSAEDDITDWPSVLECSEDKDKLRNNINDGAKKRPNEIDYVETDGLSEIESSKLLECGDGDEEGDTEDDETCYP